MGSDINYWFGNIEVIEYFNISGFSVIVGGGGILL